MASRTLWIPILALLLVLPGCTAPAPGPGTTETVETSFEDGIVLWAKNSDLPDDPNRPGEKVAWNITSTTNQSRTEDRSVQFKLDGSQDDGTIWITRPVQIEPNQRYQANVSAWAWSATESFNTLAHLVMHLGHQGPSEEEDFPSAGTNSTGNASAEAGGLREDLNKAEGWRQYSFGWTVPATEAETLYVAIGISAVWETRMTYFVDDLSIELTRLSTDAGTGASSSTY